jgi:YidC/Oxa1 family membrane protein insertase
VIFLLLPFVFAFFILDPPGGTVFPVGLLIYWMTTNLWTVGQGIVTRGLRQKAMPEPVKRSSRTPPKTEQADGAAAVEPDGAEPAPKPAGQPRKVKRKRKRGARR